MFVFLDDIRMPGDVIWCKLPRLPKGDAWTIVRNYDEFVKLLEECKESPVHISFDHDLADEHYNPETWGKGESYKEKTGLSCARALIEICLDRRWKLPKYSCHSMNPIGKKNIEETLESAKKRWF